MNWQVIVRTAPIEALVVAGERRRSVIESCERQEYLVAVLALYLEAAIGLRPCAIIDKLVYLFICGHAPCAAPQLHGRVVVGVGNVGAWDVVFSG